MVFTRYVWIGFEPCRLVRGSQELFTLAINFVFPISSTSYIPHLFSFTIVMCTHSHCVKYYNKLKNI